MTTTDAPRICVIDQRREFDRAQVCEPCRRGQDALLVEIQDLWAQLPDELEPGAGGGERVSGSREAPLPLRVAVLDLTMPAHLGSRGPMVRGALGLDDDQVGDLSVATELDGWVRDWRETGAPGDQMPVPTVPCLVTWLRNRLEWACDQHPAVDEYATAMRELRGRLRGVLGQAETDRKVIGYCPIVNVYATHEAACGAPLTADPWIDIIECPRCSTRWGRAQWQYLALTIKRVEAA